MQVSIQGKIQSYPNTFFSSFVLPIVSFFSFFPHFQGVESSVLHTIRHFPLFYPSLIPPFLVFIHICLPTIIYFSSTYHQLLVSTHHQVLAHSCFHHLQFSLVFDFHSSSVFRFPPSTVFGFHLSLVFGFHPSSVFCFHCYQ